MKDVFEALEARARPRSRLHPCARRPAPGSPARLRAHVEHVARPPDPRVRDPEVRRRSRFVRTSSSRSTELADEKVQLLARAFASQRGKHWFDEELLPRADAASRDGVGRRGFAEAFAVASSRSLVDMIFVADRRSTEPGCRARAPRGRARLLRPHVGRAEFAARGLNATARAVQHLVQPRAGNAPRHALSGRAARGGEARALHGGRDLRRRRRPPPRLATLRAGSASSSSAENRLALYVPEGCAHGFLTLTRRLRGRVSDVASSTRPRPARGVRFDDPAFGIDWPAEVLVINERDRDLPGLRGSGDRDATASPGERDARAHGRALPDLPQHHRRRRARDACGSWPTGFRSRCTRCRAGRRSSTGPCPTSGTSRRLDRDADGERVVDFRSSNLHVVSYSEPVARAHAARRAARRTCTRSPERPDWIPYRTSYYARHWGFCLDAARSSTRSSDASTRSCIDSTLAPGSLTYGELVAPGRATRRDPAHDARLPPVARQRQPLGHRAARRARGGARGAAATGYSYRFLFIPGTIGSLTWLARNEDCCSSASSAASSSPASATARRSPTSAAAAATPRSTAPRQHVLSRSDGARVVDFVPWGWDERQFNSPGFDLAGRLAQPVARGRVPRVPLLG